MQRCTDSKYMSDKLGATSLIAVPSTDMAIFPTGVGRQATPYLVYCCFSCAFGDLMFGMYVSTLARLVLL